MKLKSLFALLLAISLFFGAGLFLPDDAAIAQANPPRMTVTAAYTGYFKYGEWLPVWVELENQGRDIKAEIRIEINTSQGLIVYSLPVSLPAGSHKLAPVYVLPNNFSREMEVKLVENGKTLTSANVSVRPQPNISYFAGLIAPERGALSLLSGVQLPGQERPKIIVDLTLAEMPDRAEALRTFDLLILNNTDTSKLTEEQKAALTGWVQQGGHLVIGGGASAQRTLAGLPDSLLPLKVNATTEVAGEDIQPIAAYAQTEPFQGNGPFVTSRGELAPESQVNAGTSDLPLVIERGFGGGTIHFVALDLAGAPFNGWPGSQAFWETIIGPGGGYPENMPFDVSPNQYRASSLFYALSNIPSLDLPSIKGILVILGLYILFIGPVNFFILRWKRKLHLAWITIPALTALFTAGSFGIGYTMRGNDLVLNKIALVQVGSSGDASVTSYMGLFSPRQQNYEVKVSGEGLLSPMSGYDGNPWGTGGLNTSGGEMVFGQGNPATLKGLTVNQWAMQSFMSEGIWRDFGSLTGNLSIDNDALVGSVRNESKFTLTDVAVIMQNRFVKLGDMAPGEEKPVNLGLANLQTDRFGPGLSYRMFQENYANVGAQMPRTAELKTNIVSSVFENTPWMKAISSSGFPQNSVFSSGAIIVMGWLDQAPPDVQVEDSRLSYQTTALVFTNLDFHLPESGFLTLPPGLIPGAITKYPVEGGTCGYGTSVNMGRGEAEFEFQVPANLMGSEITTLKLALQQDIGVQMGLPQVALYHWEDDTWTYIQDPIAGTNIIQNASPYLNNGTIRVKVSNDTNNFSCIYLDMGLEAEQAAGQGGAQ